MASMKTKIVLFLDSLKGSFWFIPVLMICGAVIMSFCMVILDRELHVNSQRFYGFMYAVSPEGARSVLSTIAGSMMTVAGVTFSITIVVLNLASSQFGPRLLRNFMQDRGTQFVLGTFVASFIYCLLVLRSVYTVGQNTFVPSFSVTFAVILAFLNVGVLIYFIHHIATSIQADHVIATVSRELHRSIRHIFADDIKDESGDIIGSIAELQKENIAHFHTHPLPSRDNGYIQAINVASLMQTAIKSELLIHSAVRTGQFVVAGSTLAVVSSAEEFADNLTDQITEAFIIGDQRTSKQDPEFSIDQLVEVAVRALSPGINDPHTAIDCVDQLGSALCLLAKREMPGENRFDAEGELRLVVKPFTFEGMLNASFDQIRQYGWKSVAVTIRLLEVLTIIIGQTRRSAQRKALYRQANMILRTSREALPERNDREDVLQRYQLLLAALNEFDAQEGPYAIPDGLPHNLSHS